MKSVLVLALSVLLVRSASAQDDFAELTGMPLGAIREVSRDFSPGAPASDGDDVIAEEESANFEYGDIEARMERISTCRRSRSGVCSRAADQDVRYIVIHAALGTYEGTIRYLRRRGIAAHFIVAADGRVARMADVGAVATHVKNDHINAHSIGIETETGHAAPACRPSAAYFDLSDWDPDSRWRMYASLAGLIRAVAHETGLIPRGYPVRLNRAQVITHEEADRDEPVRRECMRHTDPGPYFEGALGSYARFTERFPGEAVTPREFLMRLVNDSQAPEVSIGFVRGARTITVRDPEGLGVSSVSIRPQVIGQAGDSVDWTAPAGALPSASVELPIGNEACVVQARDLVGNLRSVTIAADGYAGLY